MTITSITAFCSLPVNWPAAMLTLPNNNAQQILTKHSKQSILRFSWLSTNTVDVDQRWLPMNKSDRWIEHATKKPEPKVATNSWTTVTTIKFECGCHRNRSGLLCSARQDFFSLYYSAKTLETLAYCWTLTLLVLGRDVYLALLKCCLVCLT
jgi:hypothetical protein